MGPLAPSNQKKRGVDNKGTAHSIPQKATQHHHTSDSITAKFEHPSTDEVKIMT